MATDEEMEKDPTVCVMGTVHLSMRGFSGAAIHQTP